MVAGVLARLGFYLGGDLNLALDNLWFTLLFKRPEILSMPDTRFDGLVDLFLNAMTTRRPLSDDELGMAQVAAAFARPQHDVEWLQRRARSLVAACHDAPVRAPALAPLWGWKEPNTHVILERLWRRVPTLTYIHVIRNGLDMACSDNQNQLRLWGELFGPAVDAEWTPRRSLAYWCAAHRRLLRAADEPGRRFLLLNYDRLCREAERDHELGRLFDFLSLAPARRQIDEISAAVVPPASIGRFKAHPPEAFDAADVAYVRSLGFDTQFG